MALAAYTIIGATLTPVILAAFLWRRVTRAAGVASLVRQHHDLDRDGSG